MRVFVYGTLTDPDWAAAVLNEVTCRGPAGLEGLHHVDGSYPTLAPGGQVDGRLLETDDVAALDRYEGVDGGLYVRMSLPLVHEEFPRPESVEDSTRPEVDGSADDGHGDDDPDGSVETYVGDPDWLDAPAEWPGEGAFAERVGSYLDGRQVCVRSLPGDARSFPGDRRSGSTGPDVPDT